MPSSGGGVAYYGGVYRGCRVDDDPVPVSSIPRLPLLLAAYYRYLRKYCK